MPGEEPKDKTAKLYPVCEKCLAVDGDPVKERPNCGQKSGDCQTGARRWAESELAVMTEAMRRGDMEKKEEWLRPKQVAKLPEVLAMFELRGPADKMQRLGSLRALWEQTTGRLLSEMDWADLTEDLVRDWAEMRQEAGRLGWLGVVRVGAAKPRSDSGPRRGKNMPANGWAELRARRAAGSLPALDTRTAAAWNTTIRGYLTNVKSIFGLEARQNVLRGLVLPELKEFLAVSLDLPTPKGHKALTNAQAQALLTGADVLRVTNPRLWLVNQLLMRLGCRPVEVMAARLSWIERINGEVNIIITNREDEGFTIKAGADGVERIIGPLPADLVAAIDELGTETSLIGAKHKTEARELVGYDHSQWVRKTAGLTGSQTNYLFRHWALAERMTSQGADAAAALAGHAGPAMVQKVYGRYLARVMPITDGEILRRLAA